VRAARRALRDRYAGRAREVAAACRWLREISAIVTDLPRFDNSPVVARTAELAGRTPVLVTTNGTVAIGIARKLAREIVLGAFVNASAIVEYMRRRAPASIAILPAGLIGKQQCCIEDDGCADVLAARLSGAAVDAAAILAGCRSDERIVRRRATQPGLAEDIDLCFAVDAVPVVPHVDVADDRAWFAISRSRA
jgi:phosphosulfolactate phosphohydrolase-like enzyme